MDDIVGSARAEGYVVGLIVGFLLGAVVSLSVVMVSDIMEKREEIDENR